MTLLAVDLEGLLVKGSSPFLCKHGIIEVDCNRQVSDFFAIFIFASHLPQLKKVCVKDGPQSGAWRTQLFEQLPSQSARPIRRRPGSR